MSNTEWVIMLQLGIIALLCEPQERRPRLVRVFAIIVAGVFIIQHVAPAVFGFLLEVFDPVIRKIGWVYSLCILVGIGYIIALGVGFWMDAKNNRAIRAGSQEAFDRRVATYMRSHRYSREDAIAATAKIRDEKKA